MTVTFELSLQDFGPLEQANYTASIVSAVGGVISADQITLSIAAGSISTLLVSVMRVGAPPGTAAEPTSWKPLPALVAVCAAAKLAAAPVVLLILAIRRRVLRAPAATAAPSRGSVACLSE